MSLWDDFKAHLPEKGAQRQCPTNVQFSHHDETATIGKGEVLVPIAEEERSRPVSSRFVNGLDP